MRFIADEHIAAAVVRQLRRKYPNTVDMMHVAEAGIAGASDPELLEWAARENRIVISRDKATLTDFAFERIHQGLTMPGVITLTRDLAIGQLLKELTLIVECMASEELENRVYYIP